MERRPRGSLPYVNTMVLTATGSPPGGTFSWTTSSDKVQLINPTQSGTTSTVTVKSVKESDAPQDVQIDLAYTKGITVRPDHPIRVTVQRPTSMGLVPPLLAGRPWITTDCA